MRSNFTAIDPPEWLQQDMAAAEKHLPGVKVFVLFSDQLGHLDDLLDKDPEAQESATYSRRLAFGRLARQHWPAGSAHTVDLSLVAHQPLAAIRYNGICTDVGRFCQISGVTEKIRAIHVAPTHAALLLPTRELTARGFARRSTGFSRPAASAANPHRAAFWHEVTHLRVALQPGTVIREKIDEQTADIGVTKNCDRTGDSLTANFALACRLAGTFTSVIDGRASIYWNSLSLYGIKAPEEAEFSSLLELKLRAIGRKPHTAEPLGFVRDIMTRADQADIRDAYRNRDQADTLVRRLFADRQKPYTFPESRELAERLMHAASLLSPGIFTRSPQP